MSIMTSEERHRLHQCLDAEGYLFCRQLNSRSFTFIGHSSYHVVVTGFEFNATTTDLIDHYISMGLQPQLTSFN